MCFRCRTTYNVNGYTGMDIDVYRKFYGKVSSSGNVGISFVLFSEPLVCIPPMIV